MGWTSYHATHYKNGKIDRKAECDAYFLDGLNAGYYDVLKSSMVGSTYYAAVKPLKKYGSDGKEVVDIPESEQEVIGVVFLTSTDSKDYYNFSYKDMSETMGPYQRECPKSILDLLTPTENTYANEWRKDCYANLAKKKDKDSLNNLPVGSVIRVEMPFDTKYFKRGTVMNLTKCAGWPGQRAKWFASSTVYFTASLMKSLDGHYEIVKRGE